MQMMIAWLTSIDRERWFRVGVFIVLALAALTRGWKLNLAKGYVFDEVYHVVTARLMAHNDPRAFEWWHPAPEPNTAIDWLHPPLAKYTQALAIITFGDNEWGWRASSASFGVGCVLATMLLAHALFRSRVVTLCAGVFAVSDGLLLVMSRVTMNDIHVTTWLVFGFWAYWRRLSATQAHQWRWWLASVIFMGLAMGSKWSGVFGFGVIMAIELGFLVWKDRRGETIQSGVGWWVVGAALAPMLYVSSYFQMFWQGKSWSHLVELHRQIWAYQTTLTATHPYQSRPLEWFFNVRPVWMFVKYEPTTIGNIYAFANPLLSVLIWVAVGYVASISLWGWWQAVTRGWMAVDRPVRAWLLPFAYLLLIFLSVWLPWIISPRIMFFYHYTPAIPLACILVAGTWTQLWREIPISSSLRWGVLMVPLALVGMVFLLWYPHWTAIQVSPQWAKLVYYAFPSWK